MFEKMVSFHQETIYFNYGHLGPLGNFFCKKFKKSCSWRTAVSVSTRKNASAGNTEAVMQCR